MITSMTTTNHTPTTRYRNTPRSTPWRSDRPKELINVNYIYTMDQLEEFSYGSLPHIVDDMEHRVDSLMLL